MASKEFKEAAKEIVIGHDFADAGQDKFYIQDALKRLNQAHESECNERIREAALSTLCPQCGATEAWHILNPDNHRSQAALPRQEGQKHE